MGRKCSICIHAERDAIEDAVASGESYRRIANRFDDISARSLARHCKNGHIQSVVLAPIREVEVLDGGGILAEMGRLLRSAEAIQVKAEEWAEGADDQGGLPSLNTAIRAIREQSRIAENLFKLAALLAAHGSTIEEGGQHQPVGVETKWR